MSQLIVVFILITSMLDYEWNCMEKLDDDHLPYGTAEKS